jgi:hypothetical protein
MIWSPSASMSKGFLYVGVRVTPSNEKFDVTSFRRRACSSGDCFSKSCGALRQSLSNASALLKESNVAPSRSRIWARTVASSSCQPLNRSVQ